MHSEKPYPRFLLVSGVLAALIAVYGLSTSGVFTERVGYGLISSVLMLYLSAEIWVVARRGPTRWLLNPAVMASLYTFVASYVLSNIAHLWPGAFPQAKKLLERVGFEWMLPAAVVIAIGAVGMWNGYHSRLGETVAKGLKNTPLLNRVLRNGVEARWALLILFATVSIAVRLFQISIGAYGYVSILSMREQYVEYLRYINILGSLGALSLGIGCLSYFASQRRSLWKAVVLAGMLAAELFFGLLSGFKSQVVFPFIVVGVAYYVARGRIPKLAVGGAIVAVVFAYQVMGTYRYLENNYPGFQHTNVEYLTSVVVDIAQGETEATGRPSDPRSIWAKLVSRKGLTGYTALSMQYADTHNLTPEDPNFLRDIFLSPAYAVVPRILWPSKPRATLGGWFYREVIGGTTQTSVGMGPVAYLWFGGGIAAVFFGFFVVGGLQRAAYEYFFLFASGGGIIVFISILMPLIKVNNIYYSTFIELIRTIPLSILFQLAVIKK